MGGFFFEMPAYLLGLGKTMSKLLGLLLFNLDYLMEFGGDEVSSSIAFTRSIRPHR